MKPTSTVGQVDGTGLKIRISRYSAAPGRSQQQKPDINNLPHAGGAGGEAAPPPTATPLGARARTASSPRTSRRTRRSSCEQILEEVRGDHPVKQERDDIDLRKVNRVNRECEVKLNSLEAIKMEDMSSDSSDDSEKRFKHSQPSLDIGMTGREIVEECERVGPGTGPISTSVFDRFPIPRPLKRAELPRVSKENLLPPTPCVYIRTAQEAFSPQLMDL